MLPFPMSCHPFTLMNRNLFISWSGDRSREAASYFRDWITRVIPTANPFFSDDDIRKGAISREVLDDKLRDSSFGIVFLTFENRHAPWIHYEVGMLNARKVPISSLMLNLNYSDVVGPIQNFQHSSINKVDCLHLIQSLRDFIAPDVKEESLVHFFECAWPDFQGKISELNSKYDAINAASLHLESMPRIQKEACLAELCHLYHMPDGSAPERANSSLRGTGSLQLRPLQKEAYFRSSDGNVYHVGELLNERQADQELHTHWLEAQRLMLDRWGNAILDKYSTIIQALKEQSETCYFEGTEEE